MKEEEETESPCYFAQIVLVDQDDGDGNENKKLEQPKEEKMEVEQEIGKVGT